MYLIYLNFPNFYCEIIAKNAKNQTFFTTWNNLTYLLFKKKYCVRLRTNNEWLILVERWSCRIKDCIVENNVLFWKIIGWLFFSRYWSDALTDDLKCGENTLELCFVPFTIFCIHSPLGQDIWAKCRALSRTLLYCSSTFHYCSGTYHRNKRLA